MIDALRGVDVEDAASAQMVESLLQRVREIEEQIDGVLDARQTPAQ